jgi:RIO-like serine/threonine protein kinase
MDLDIAALVRRGRRLGEARNATKAEVFLVEEGGRRLVVKTFAHRERPSRLGVALLRREGRVLAQLAGTRGVPALLAAHEDALVLEWRPGETLHERRKRGISAQMHEEILAVVAGLHARGFAHGDLGRHDVLVANDGSVSLVDFATAVGPGMPPLLWRVLLPFWKRRDRAHVAKFARRYRRRWEKRQALAAARRQRRQEGQIEGEREKEKDGRERTAPEQG